MAANCRQRERQTLWRKFSDVRNAGSDGTTPPPSSTKRNVKAWGRKLELYQSCVAMLGAGLWGYVVLCSDVPWGGSRFTYCMLTNSRGKIFVEEEEVPPLSTQFILLFIDFLFWGNNSTSGSIAGFIKLQCPSAGWLVVWEAFPSFEIVRLTPTGTPWSCQSTFQLGSWLRLAVNCQTCITWKALHRF